MKKILLLSLKTITALILLATAAGLIIYIQFNPTPPSAQAYINGHILTMDSRNSVVEAVYIEDDKIIATGTSAEIQKMAKGEVHDLQGKTMMPGIIDAHGHFPGSGLAAVAVDLNSPPINQVKNINDALELLRAKSANTAKGEWIYAYGFDDTQVAEQRFLSRSELDGVSTDHPIFVSHVSGHMGIANSLAFSKAGIDKYTEAPEGGLIRHNAEGELAGVVEENAQRPILMQALDLGLSEFWAMSRYASAEYLQQGVTTAQNGLADVKMLKGISALGRIGIYPQRLVLWPDLTAAKQIQSGELSKNNLESERVQIGALKLIADGSIQGYTGFLGHPYHDIPEGKKSDYRGYPTMSEQELNQAVAEFHKNGWQIAMHGNGDASIDMIINAFRKAQEQHPRDDARPIIIHAQMTRDDQLDKFAELKMSPSFFNAHVYYWGDRHKKLFMGPERAARMSPMNGALRRKVPFTLHLDTPIVPMTPFLAAWSAVSRESSSGEVLGAEQAISPEQALRAITIDAAWQIFAENNRGSIEKGKFADLIVLDRNPLSSPDAMKNVKVLNTIIGGVNRYSKEAP